MAPSKGEVTMKKAVILISSLLVLTVQAQELEVLNDLSLFGIGNPDLIPVQEDPGPNAEVINQTIHTKTITVEKDDFHFKWTTLGYGALTYKVIIPPLAAHTLFNHRNPGEEGPCLRSLRLNTATDFEGSSSGIEAPPQEISVTIKALNQYRINREKKICKVTMVEYVKTVINDEVFDHRYTKDMGYRYIDDCLLN